jgi:hypothetical protein
MNMRHIVDDVRESAQQALDTTEASAVVAKVGVLEAIGQAAKVYRALKALGLDDMLRSAGLQRRRGPGLSIGMFGMGMAAGAVIGVMLAPSSGHDARRAIARRAAELVRGAGTSERGELRSVKRSVEHDVS